MKKIRIVAIIAVLVSTTGCNLFLEMPEVTGSVYREDVFSNRKDTEGMLWRAYHRGLREGLPEGWAINHGTLASLSGEITRGYSWHAGYNLVVNGPTTVLDASGHVLGSVSAPRHVESIAASEDRLLVLFTGEEATLFDTQLREIVSYQPEAGVNRIFLTHGGMGYFAGPEGVTQIDFGR